MNFSRRKLPITDATDLRLCPLESVKPFTLMLAPVYIFMRRNGKFVSIKGPMDFFTPEELERFQDFDSFYLPLFIDRVLPFRDAAARIRVILSWVPGNTLPPAPFELSDAILRIVGPLWASSARVEPFFVSVLANELCSPIPGESLKRAREQDVELFERAIHFSSWVVFLALHLGYVNLGFLSELRLSVFSEVMYEKQGPSRGLDLQELIEIAHLSMPAENLRELGAQFFESRPERVSQKLSARLTRVREEMIESDKPGATIYGEGGFIDV